MVFSSHVFIYCVLPVALVLYYALRWATNRTALICPGKFARTMYKDVFSEAEIVQRKALWHVLVRHFFQKYVKPEETVLDIGSGWGEFINEITARRRVAIDVSGEYHRYHGPGLLYSVQSCCNLAFKDGAADVAFASNVFEHLASRDALVAALKEIRRILRPGGRQPDDYLDVTCLFRRRGTAAPRSAKCTSGFTPEAATSPYVAR